MRTKPKLSIGVVFSLGAIIIVVDVLRTYFRANASKVGNDAKDLYVTLILDILEWEIAVGVSSLLVFRGYISASRKYSSSRRSTSFTVSQNTRRSVSTYRPDPNDDIQMLEAEIRSGFVVNSGRPESTSD